MSGASNPDIRIASEGDAVAVRECVVVAYSKYIERIGKKPAPMLDDYGALARAGAVWVLADGDEIFGAIAIREIRAGGDHLFIENVVVNPEKQRRGFGRKLMAFADGKAAESSLAEVRLYTNEKMWENLAFYERLGFEETERRLDGGYRRVFMRKRPKTRR